MWTFIFPHQDGRTPTHGIQEAHGRKSMEMDWSLDWSTVFAGLLVVVTFGLYWVARQQTELTRQQLQLARQQMHDTRVLQRAYVGALPGGVSTTTHGELLAHVELKNVGHLPASQVRSVLKFTPSDDGAWSPPNVDDKDLRPAGVLPVGMSVTTGSHGIGVPQPWTKYLYAWGRITYLDGFGKERRTNFCHRYNTEPREPQTGGRVRIAKEYGRHHEYGNDAN
jgi:hypothetical protein